MTFERWLWVLEGAARYFEILERTYQDEAESKTRIHITKVLMDICDDCETYDLGEFAKACRQEKGRLEEFAKAAAEGGSAGISIRVMLPTALLGRVAFDAEGAALPDTGTTYFFETGPKGDRLLASTPDEDGWREVPHQQGRAGARAGWQGEGGAGEGLSARVDRELSEDQVPEDPDSVGGK